MADPMIEATKRASKLHFCFDSTLAIQESTLCRSGKDGEALSGNSVKSGGEGDITK